MKLVVGLGNPGPKYELTRHNVGFLLVDRLVERFKATGPTKKFESEGYDFIFQGEKCLLLKPQTFMNLSGRAVAQAYRFYKCVPTDLIVIHDELDLDPGQLRLKSGGGSGGHNGIKSIDASVGSENTSYYRVRMGIGHPRRLGLQEGPVDFVLKPYSDTDLKVLDGSLDQAAEAVEMLLKGKLKEAMNRFHTKVEG